MLSPEVNKRILEQLSASFAVQLSSGTWRAGKQEVSPLAIALPCWEDQTPGERCRSCWRDDDDDNDNDSDNDEEEEEEGDVVEEEKEGEGEEGENEVS
eukprot:749671-Hanusia_phi.AAC.8